MLIMPHWPHVKTFTRGLISHNRACVRLLLVRVALQFLRALGFRLSIKIVHGMQATVAYYLMADNRRRMDSSAYLRAELTEAHQAHTGYPPGTPRVLQRL